MEFEYTEHWVSIPIPKRNDADIVRNGFYTQSKLKVTTKLHPSLFFFSFGEQV